jgi:hypothetical protein
VLIIIMITINPTRVYQSYPQSSIHVFVIFILKVLF